MSKLVGWVPLVIALVLNAAANVLLRIGAVKQQSPGSEESLVAKGAAFLNATTIIAMALFGMNLLFYRKALERVPLTVGYPIMLSGSLVLATVAAAVIPSLGEKLSALQLVGMGLILVGVWVVIRS
jgi:small multidrug resistance pump